MNIPEEFRLAAKRGAALLDEQRPGWERAVNPLTLDLGDLEQCVLGQLEGEYGVGVANLSLGYGDVHEMGFNLNERRPWDWVKLTKAWLTEIYDRRWASSDDINTEAVNQ